VPDTMQTSRDKSDRLRCTTAEFTFCILDGYGLRDGARKPALPVFIRLFRQPRFRRSHRRPEDCEQRFTGTPSFTPLAPTLATVLLQLCRAGLVVFSASSLRSSAFSAVRSSLLRCHLGTYHPRRAKTALRESPSRNFKTIAISFCTLMLHHLSDIAVVWHVFCL